MKKIYCLFTLFISSLIYCQTQSTSDYGTGTNIDIGAGADVCADVIAGAGTYSGTGHFCSGPLVFAQDGALDLTFNVTGKVENTSLSGMKSVAIQADQKIVVAGYSNNGTNDDFAVVRYNSDGTLDNTFGTSGKVTTSIGSYNDVAYSIAIQSSDQKIVVTGLTSNGTDNDLAVVRYNSNGTLDNTFGTSGIVTAVVGNSDNPGFGVALQSDGKIVAAGYAHIGSYDDFAVVRFTSVGAFDNTFGANGVVTTNFGAGAAVGNSIAVQTDGKIVVAGYFSSGGTAVDFAVARYNSNGTLDTGFDTDGKVMTAIGAATDWGNSVAIQSDGKIVVAGYSNNGTNDDFAVIRYNSDGSLDTGFDTDGKVTTAIGSGSDWGYSIAIQLDGKIVVAGFTFNGSNNDFAVVRYNSDGSLDTGFDTDGKVTTDFGSGSYDVGNSVALQTDGKIIVAGMSHGYYGALVRYTGSSGPVVLPVELTSFTASVTTGRVALKWKTATEVNNYGFEIERMTPSQTLPLVDGGQGVGWSKIGFVEGAGTTNAPKEYSFSDKNISSSIYSYRLKQIDRDGKFEYSQSVEVTVGQTPNVFALEQNYPNPFNPSTMINFQLSTNGFTLLKVYDAIGREVATLVNETKEAGYYSETFDGTKHSSGIYFVRLQSGDKVQLKKMQLLK